MNLIKHADLTARELRYFGVSMVATITLLAGLLVWRWGQSTAALGLLGCDLVFASIYFAFPTTQRTIHDAFIRVTSPIASVMTFVILGIVFFVVFLPIGLVLRLFRHDVRRTDFEAASHWVKREKSPEPKRYYDAY